MHTKCSLCEDTEFGIVIMLAAATEDGTVLDRVLICQRCYTPRVKTSLANLGLTIGHVGKPSATGNE